MHTTITLHGNNNILLKALAGIDISDLTVQANNPEVARYLRDIFPSPYTLKDARNFLTLIQQGKTGYVWGIFHDHKVAGVISITPQQDIYRHSAEIGYWLGTDYHGKGIMTTAVALTTAYAFQTLKLYKIYARVFAGNIASQQVLLKNGYHLEAVKYKAIIKNEVLMDEHYFVRFNPDIHL